MPKIVRERTKQQTHTVIGPKGGTTIHKPLTKKQHSAKHGPWDLLVDGRRVDRSNNRSALEGRADAMRRVYRKHGVKHSVRIVVSPGF